MILAACSGGAGDIGSETTGPPDSAPPADDPTTTTGNGGGLSEVSGLSFSVADGWSALALGQGVKPALALDPAGEPGVTWLFEALGGEGFVAYAEAGAGWEVETPLEGYFYGPIGLAYSPNGVPNVVIHDHQADNFDPQLGDLVRLWKDGSEWAQDVAADDGHDGWDSTIVVGEDGAVHAAGVDPSQFGSPDGVEYYFNDGTGWTVAQVGSGPIPYQYNVSLALDPSGSPALTYYDHLEADLVLASLVDGSWNLEPVFEEGDVGKYSSLAFDGEGRPAISFFSQTSGSAGEILFATGGEGDWNIETVGGIDAFFEGNARRNSSLAFDSDGRAHVVFSDTEGVWYSVRGDTGWETQQIVEGDLTLGQLVSLAIDQDDRPHIAIYEVTASEPLDGVVAYLTTTG